MTNIKNKTSDQGGPASDGKNKTSVGIEVKRNERESSGSLLRRFTQRVRSSGILLEARRHKFKRHIPNKNARRRSALVRAADREKYKELRKWGKIK